MKRRHSNRFGAEVEADGVRFRLWAPRADAVALRLEGNPSADLAMDKEPDGSFVLTTASARPGTRYHYVVDGHPYPDPASRCQPNGVHGPSEVVDPFGYSWSDENWSGRGWSEMVLYELHLGTFSPSGNFAGALGHFDYLRGLGITAIELMPIAEFPGARNWGYDGAFLYAPSSRYGRPDELKALVEAAHSRGLAVMLDVVYNHFGPEGNYLPAIAPDFFTERHRTPWGAAIDFDGAHSRAVRTFFIDNALYWLEEYHLDGLRFDAIHAIFDNSAPDIIDEIGETVRRRIPGREIHLVLENDRNEAGRLTRRRDGRPERFTAQWNDDLHHVLQLLIAGDTTGYYADYADDPADRLGRALAEGFAYQGEASPFRDGRRRGEPSAQLPPGAFVSFLQNHDQVGNLPFGTRLAARASTAALHAGLAIVMLSPQIPMLFMGEEWASHRPFAFFCDFEPQLAQSVREGRRREFADFVQSGTGGEGRIPDPTAEATFMMSKLDWDEPSQARHALWLARYRALIDLRRREIVPRLADMAGFAGTYRVLGPRAVAVEWSLGRGARLSLTANFSDQPVPLSTAADGWRLLYSSDRAGGPMSASFFLLGAAVE
jgi:maltooligosyltrehalose trehalohydrolase